MGNRIYVGNLASSVTNADLEQLFAPYGTVKSATVVTDRATGQGKGFAFVEMNSPTEAQAAIDGLNGKDLNGRALTVNEARPRAPGGPGGGGGGGRGGRRY